MKPITARQRELLAFVRSYTADHGYAPCVREIGNAMGIRSPNGVICHLRALVKRGAINYDARVARSIRVVGGENATDQDMMAVCRVALAHVRQLEDAFLLGALRVRDGSGGTIPNRNLEVLEALQKVVGF